MSFEQILDEHTKVHNNLRSSFGNVRTVHFFVTQTEYGVRVGSLKVTFDKTVSPHSKSVLVQNTGKKDTKTDFKKVVQLIKKQAEMTQVEQSTIDEYDVVEKLEALHVSEPSTALEQCRPEYNKEELKRLADKHSLLFIKVPKEKRLNVITGGVFLSKDNELTDSMSKLHV